MRYFLVFVLILLLTTAYSQDVYTTTASGNFSLQTTWVDGRIPPGACNCKIKIMAGHSVTISTAVNLTNATIELNGTTTNKSQMLFSGSSDLILNGTSAIDVQNANGRIFSSNQNNSILFGSIEIFKGKNTKINSTTDGEVLGPASASSKRTDVTFKNFVLPVKLSHFQASNVNDKVLLSWRTETELNSDDFEVERSADSKSWRTIGLVKASGTTSTVKEYHFTDFSPQPGNNFYRLKMIDIDAKFEYSMVKSVNLAAANFVLTVSPNPARSVIKVSVSFESADEYSLKLINRSGQIVYSGKFQSNTNQVTIPATNFAEGSYFLELVSNKFGRQTRAVVIAGK